MSSIRRTVALVAGPVLSMIVASSVVGASAAPRHAHGTFVDTSGVEIGRVKLTEDGHGIVHVDVKLKAPSLSTGDHGIHIHATGSCATTSTAFDGAGGHYNPLGHEHGLENPNGPHAGDLPNLEVDGHGHGRLDAKTDHVTLVRSDDAARRRWERVHRPRQPRRPGDERRQRRERLPDRVCRHRGGLRPDTRGWSVWLPAWMS